jgi:hypothetical protein
MPDGQGFFSSDMEIFRSNPYRACPHQGVMHDYSAQALDAPVQNPDGLQGKATQYGGKKTGQTVFNGCKYRF